MIYLYDISAMVCSGSYARRSKNWNQMYFPTGGLYKVFTYLFRDLKKLKEGDKIIACFEGEGNIRKDEFPFYKGTRSKYRSDVEREIVAVQCQALKEYLPRIGIPILHHKGLEADDMIYSVVAQNPEEPITIRADDADMFGTLKFNSRVTMESVVGREIIMDRNKPIFKVCDGDLSDNIPGLSENWYKTAVVQASNQGVLDIYKQGTLKELVVRLQSIGMPIAMIPEVARNIFLIQPKIVELPELLQPKIDKNELSIVLNILGFKSFLMKELGEERDYYSNKVKDGLVKLLSTTTEELKNHFLEIRKKEDTSYLERNPEVDLGNREIKSRVSDLDKALQWTDQAVSGNNLLPKTY